MLSFRLWKKKSDEPISKVLNHLQSEINNHELRASSLRQKQRSIKGQTTLYSVLIYLTYVLYYALSKAYELDGQTVALWSAKTGVMLAFPVSVYGVRSAITWWYTRKIEREVNERELLKTRLEEKIEELKEKSDYYNTQQLLERFDSKASSRNSLPDTLGESPQQQRNPQHKASSNDLHNAPSMDALRQRGNSRTSLPPLPPPINPSTFAVPPSIPAPQNIPQFHPSAFSPPPSPILPAQQQPKTFLDRVLDLLVGEDENAADKRYALICRHCRAHNGLAPPGERAEEVGYLCGRCGGWNGPEPNSQTHKSQPAKETTSQLPQEKEVEAVEQSVSGDKDKKESTEEMVETQGKEE